MKTEGLVWTKSSTGLRGAPLKFGPEDNLFQWGNQGNVWLSDCQLQTPYSQYTVRPNNHYLCCPKSRTGGSVVKNLPAIQELQVRSLVQEDPERSHMPWSNRAHALKHRSHGIRVPVVQLLKPTCLEPALRTKRSHGSEKPVHRQEEKPQLTATNESPHSNKGPAQP